MKSFKQDRFIRWQNKLNDLFTNTINLIFTLTLGLFALLAQGPFEISKLKTPFTFLTISIFLGTFAIISRLFDVKYTVKITRIKIKSKSKERIRKYRIFTDILGCCSWGFFLLQMLFLMIAIVFVNVSLFSL